MIWIYLAGFILAIAKWLEVEFLADISWWWVLSPLFLAVLWFEVLERMLGMDKRSELKDSDVEKAKRERINKQLGRDAKGRRL
jgi:small Trp-rich protein